MLGSRATPPPATRASGRQARTARSSPSRSPRDPRPVHRQLDRGGEAHDAGQVRGPGATPALLAAAPLRRRGLQARPQHQRTDPGRTAELVGREADQVGAELGQGAASACRTPGPRRSGRGRRRHGRAGRSRRPAGGRRSRCWRSITETRAGRSSASSRARAARSMTPSASTGIRRASGTASSTLACSVAPTRRGPGKPRRARPLASVPPLVNTTRSCATPMCPAMVRRDALEQLARMPSGAMRRGRIARRQHDLGHGSGHLGPDRRGGGVVEIDRATASRRDRPRGRSPH